MILCADIGNSSISFGMFEGSKFLSKTILGYSKDFFQADFERLLKNVLTDKQFSECVVMSVADEITPIICNLIKNVCKITPVVITHNMHFGFKINAKNPAKIGIDRIANICAASKIYSGAIIVVDFGTATTFDIMDDKNNFIGGLIMPGIGTQLKSLSENTSKLPGVDFNDFEKVTAVINTETEKAMLTGVIKGHAYAVEGLLSDCEKELNTKPVIVATGGYAPFISKYFKKLKFDKFDTNLTLRGLIEIYMMNLH